MASPDARALAAEVAELRRRLMRLERTAQGNLRSWQDDDGNDIDLADLAEDVSAAHSNGLSALDDAAAAQSSASGKNTVFYAASAPTAIAVGDLWFDTAHDNAPHMWDGSTWVSLPLGNLAIGNLDAGKITTGTLVGIIVESAVAGGLRVVMDAASHALNFYDSTGAQVGSLSVPSVGLMRLTNPAGSQIDLTATGVSIRLGSLDLQQSAASITIPTNGRILAGATVVYDATTKKLQADNLQITGGGAVLDAATHPYPKWSGATQRTFDGGTRTATVDANNRITFGHNVGAAAIAATANGTDASYGLRWRDDLSDASNLVFGVRDSSGTLVAPGTSVTVAFIAVG